MSDQHKHIWQTRFTIIECANESYRCASGMRCECGAELQWDVIEEIINWATERAIAQKRLHDLFETISRGGENA